MQALTYRPRLLEVEAIRLPDGRYLLLTEEPCYMEADEFDASYEPIRERRSEKSGGGRRSTAATNGNRAGTGRAPTTWTCRECSAETVGGSKCGHCGKYTRYARAAAADE